MCVAANVNGSGQPATTTDIVIDDVTFARWVRKLSGADVEPDGPWRPGYRCSTIDGVRLEPGEVVAAALLGDIRRIVTDAKGVVIDMGRRNRLFTGHARLAVQIPDQSYIWPGCDVQTSRCQIDHTTPWSPEPGGDPGSSDSGGGCTCPASTAEVAPAHAEKTVAQLGTGAPTEVTAAAAWLSDHGADYLSWVHRRLPQANRDKGMSSSPLW